MSDQCRHLNAAEGRPGLHVDLRNQVYRVGVDDDADVVPPELPMKTRSVTVNVRSVSKWQPKIDLDSDDY